MVASNSLHYNGKTVSVIIVANGRQLSSPEFHHEFCKNYDNQLNTSSHYYSKGNEKVMSAVKITC